VGLVIAAVARAVMSNLCLFVILIGASAALSVSVGKVGEVQMIKRINSENRELKGKITDLQAELKMLKEHFGIGDD
jgi:hypothetical protein